MARRTAGCTQRGVIGALVVHSYSSDTRYPEQNNALLQFVSTQVAAAIECNQTKTTLQYVVWHEVAEHPSHCVRKSNTVRRVGGGEFVVLLNGISLPEHAAAVAEKIRAAFDQPFDLAGHRLHVSTGIGIAVYSGHDGGDKS